MVDNSVEEDQKKQFIRALFGSTTEMERYRSYFSKEFWTPQQCAMLIAGLDPETHDACDSKLPRKEYKRRSVYAAEVLRRLLKDIELRKLKNTEFITVGDATFLSAWKYIKWIGENDIKIHKHFYKSLSLTFKELYFEFEPINKYLKTASRYSRPYHEALYLKHAEELIDQSDRDLSPLEIYNNPRMQNVQRQIRAFGGNYKKRTILESWLPKVTSCSIGRPRKIR